MPRPNAIPRCPQPPAKRSASKVSRDYEISLVTPLFGGGFEAGTPDETRPVRSLSIRGALEFWWRATRGAEFATAKELFERHSDIWGATDRPSAVDIEVHDVQAALQRRCAGYFWDNAARRGQGAWRLRWEAPFANSSLPYALFPFQGKEPSAPNALPQKEPAEFIERGSFVLRVSCPKDVLEDAALAVWAWVNFGGLGSRARRGCGALLCKELAPLSADNIPMWFRGKLSHAEAAVREWPTMPRDLHVGAVPLAPLDAWKEVISLMQTFRQGPGVGRNQKNQQNQPGRSRFSEPETIRRVTGTRSRDHGRLVHIPDDAFPRAEFGLPIVFHFLPGKGEPADTVLYPSSAPNGNRRERMASPLILKPLALADGKAVPLILRLVTPELNGVDLRRKDGGQSLPLPRSTVTRDGRLAVYQKSPLAGSASGSVIDAFLAFAAGKGLPSVKP